MNKELNIIHFKISVQLPLVTMKVSYSFHSDVLLHKIDLTYSVFPRVEF